MGSFPAKIWSLRHSTDDARWAGGRRKCAQGTAARGRSHARTRLGPHGRRMAAGKRRILLFASGSRRSPTRAPTSSSTMSIASARGARYFVAATVSAHRGHPPPRASPRALLRASSRLRRRAALHPVRACGHPGPGRRSPSKSRGASAAVQQQPTTTTVSVRVRSKLRAAPAAGFRQPAAAPRTTMTQRPSPRTAAQNSLSLRSPPLSEHRTLT